MGDNDLIKYGDVRVKVESAIEVLNNLGLTWGIYSPLWDAIDAIRDIPAVPQEMSAREYLTQEARWCHFLGLSSPTDASGLTVEKAIEMVAQWAQEHPEERSGRDD